MLVTENQLDEWVRGNARDAQAVIVELVWRLVAASCPRPQERRFPLGDSIGQHGPDGLLDVNLSFDPFVPEGRSFWEIGTGLRARDKATSDYSDLVLAIPESVRMDSTFVFVTPLSGQRDWEHTWKEEAQATWLEDRLNKHDWRDVRVIDGTKLVDWIRQFPSVERWLAQRTIGLPVQQIETLEQRWSLLRTIGEPPPLPPHVFLTNRDAACAKLKEVLAGIAVQLKLDTHFPDQVVDFVAAYVAAMDEESRIDAVGRCLVISGIEAWSAMTAHREPHILVADHKLDLAGAAGTKLLEKARRAGHSVIFGGMPGGIPHPNCESVPNPKSYQVKKALETAGYSEERARILAQKSGGNLSTLLRCLQNLSLMPEWAEGSAAAELAIAAFLGSWSERSEADRTVVEDLSGKSYGEWIGTMREIALRPGTPLTQRDGGWKFVVRYEGWYTLGPRFFDEHLDRLRKAAVSVLREKDPKFELPPAERYAAGIYGKVLAYSHLLRNGLAESLALLGGQPKALTSCSLGKAEATAVLAVREILNDADWVLWASLNDLLPLMAEAAPGEFLDTVEKALNSDPCPFDTIFAQEGNGINGGNYMTGLLWALETLAWDAEYLSRVIVLLGELAARDPGGQWANRPANSLTTILLPWLPQTCAPVSKRKAAVAALINEVPEVTWKLLLNLLPRSHQVSSGTRKPEWREMIDADWRDGVPQREYWEQIAIYAELAMSAAKKDFSKLADLIDRIDELPSPAHDQLLAYLGSDAIASTPEADRVRLWNELVDMITKHRKFADAQWAMKAEQVDKIAAIAERLAPKAPAFRHQRLFSERDFDLYEEKDNWEEQRNELDKRRQRAIDEVFVSGGVRAVLEFARAVDSPWRVGVALGAVAKNDADEAILPGLMESGDKSLAQFAGGYVRGRFHSRGWQWVDGIDTLRWAATQVGQLLAYLPFAPETWKRSAQLLGEDQSLYWTKANANPYETDKGAEVAVEHLINYGRPHAAIRCLYRMRENNQLVDTQQAVRALLAAIKSSEDTHAIDIYDVVEVIKSLQEDPRTNPDDLFRVEWAYLSLLDRHQNASPKLLERRLASDPGFFCEVIRLVFRSRKEEHPTEESKEQSENIATNAYRLLREWRTPPGCREDGTYDSDALAAWLEAVKKECSESGHLEVAMTMVGHALIHTPPDPGGLWIHRSAAAALNSKNAEDMRSGFRTELFNSRGVHWVDPTGKPEREFASKYRAQAEAVEGAGYHRLASTLRELAESYEREAERVSTREPFDN
jgi:hypothetical protein